MGARTLIEWAHHTVNFWWGCAMAMLLNGSLSEECRKCYAKSTSKRFARGRAGWGPKAPRWIRSIPAVQELLKLDQSARRRRVRERVFINSMSDTFEDRPDLNEARTVLFAIARLVTNLDLLLLTKRPQLVRDLVPKDWLQDWPAHVWIGTTAGTQASADERLPHLLRIPALVRFVSCEPLLGPVEFSIANHRSDRASVLGRPALEGIHWVICGGESGPGARPMHPGWARSLRDQCAAANVPFFMKQWGAWKPYCEPGDWSNRLYRSNRKARAHEDQAEIDESFGRTCTVPYGVLHLDGSLHEVGAAGAFWQGTGAMTVYNVGKKAAGRLLDGREHSGFPAAA